MVKKNKLLTAGIVIAGALAVSSVLASNESESEESLNVIGGSPTNLPSGAGSAGDTNTYNTTIEAPDLSGGSNNKLFPKTANKGAITTASMQTAEAPSQNLSLPSSMPTLENLPTFKKEYVDAGVNQGTSVPQFAQVTAEDVGVMPLNSTGGTSIPGVNIPSIADSVKSLQDANLWRKL